MDRKIYYNDMIYKNMAILVGSTCAMIIGRQRALLLLLLGEMTLGGLVI